jgi:AcrR family transcriptional regulator
MAATDESLTATRPLRADARRNRARLLDAADAAFADHGTSASLEDVARRAGVGIGTLYRHFPTRDDLVEAVIHDGVDDLVALADRLLDDDDPLAALRTWLRALVDHAARYRGLATALVAAGCGGEGRLTEACHRQEAAADALVARARSTGRLREDVTTSDVLDLVSALAWLAEQGRRDTADDRLLDLILDGVRPTPSPSG